MTCYDANDVRRKLENDLGEAQALKSAWQNVTYPTKKDGTPFAAMSKNFRGAVYRPTAYSIRDGKYELVIYAHSDTCGYIDDYLACYANADDLSDTQKSKPGNLMPKTGPWKQLYKYDLDDIKTRVRQRIDYLNQYCAELRGDLARLGSAYSTYQAALAKARTELHAQLTSNGTHGTHAYYQILDTADKATRHIR
nr:MAG TPA: hypothetical protein [Bacteriophage sp.]